MIRMIQILSKFFTLPSNYYDLIYNLLIHLLKLKIIYVYLIVRIMYNTSSFSNRNMLYI